MNNNRGANSCLALATVQAMFTAPATTTSIAFFKGTVPDLDALINSFAAGTNVISAAAMATALGATTDNCLAVQRLPLLTPTYDPQMNVWRVGLSALTGNVPGLASGVPTYAIIRQGTSTAAADTWSGGFANAVNVANIMLFTVGDETSNAELRLLGGQIVSGQSYRMTDLQISL